METVCPLSYGNWLKRGHCEHDHMLVQFTYISIYAIRVYLPNKVFEFDFLFWRDVLDTTLCDKAWSVTCDR